MFILKVEAKWFADRLTKCEVTVKKKSWECWYVLTLSNRVHGNIAIKIRKTWIEATVGEKIKRCILFLLMLDDYVVSWGDS